MDLKEIREAYAEIIGGYNEIFPVHPVTTKSHADEEGDFEKGNEDLAKTTRMQMTKVAAKLREEADASGNAQVWRRGEPLDGLNPGMRERIGRALKFGI